CGDCVWSGEFGGSGFLGTVRDGLGEFAGQLLGGQSLLLENVFAVGVGEELLIDTERAHRHVHVVVTPQASHGVADGPVAAGVLHHRHDPVLGGHGDQGLVQGLDPQWVDDGLPYALVGHSVGDLHGDLGHGAHPDDEQVLGVAVVRRTVQQVHGTDLADGGHLLGDRALGVAHHGGGVVDCHGLAQLGAQTFGVPWRGHAQFGDDLHDGHVPHAVVAGTVVAGDPGTVQAEGDPLTVQRGIQEYLIEAPVEEGRI